ncbi:class F sortase, partial [Nonomuraea dietziae]|uniref:class F sortase n=1 Tax=Nonomuraea dietziae TaxID=65515 RepID=UPI003419DAF1
VRPLKPVQVGTKPARPVGTDVKPLKSVRAEAKPAQPVQVGTKPARPVRKDVRPPPAQADTRPSDTKASDSPPKTIQIPSLALGARIMPVGFEEGRIASPPLSASQRVGWFSMGPEPGATGAAILVGHYDSTTGPAVFYRLSELRPGRLIYVTRKDGRRLRFRVTRKATYPKDDFPGREVYADPGRPELRLITCSGAFDTSTRHYVDNTVVYATLIGKGWRS